MIESDPFLIPKGVEVDIGFPDPDKRNILIRIKRRVVCAFVHAQYYKECDGDIQCTKCGTCWSAESQGAGPR